MWGESIDAAITRQSSLRFKVVGILVRCDTTQPALNINAASTVGSPKTGKRPLDMVQSVYIQGGAIPALHCGFVFGDPLC